jgi:hypothetical protein
MAKINIRTKGASAERQIATKLNEIITASLHECGIIFDSSDHTFFVQRNQNQTAVGGDDLINTYGFSIEVKRQETLSINTWWKQCVTSATKNSATPVLLFKQSRKPWRCILQGYIGLPNGQFGACRMEIDFDTFLIAFKHHVKHKLKG